MTTLSYALLGLLARAPLSGYDLAGQLKAPLGYFWQARHSQIYPELAALEAEKLIEHQRIEQSDRPDKKIYTITPAGRQAVADWATSPMNAPVVRDELVLRAYCLWLGDPAQASALFREHERLHAAQLAHYEEHRDQMEAACPEELRRIDSPQFAGYAALRRGIGYEREYMEWCGWLASTLERACDASSCLDRES